MEFLQIHFGKTPTWNVLSCQCDRADQCPTGEQEDGGLIGMKTEIEDIQLLPNPLHWSNLNITDKRFIQSLSKLCYVMLCETNSYCAVIFKQVIKRIQQLFALKALLPSINQRLPGPTCFVTGLCRSDWKWLEWEKVTEMPLQKECVSYIVLTAPHPEAPAVRHMQARNRLEFASAVHLLVFSRSHTSNRSLRLYPNPLCGSWMAFESETASGSRRQKEKPSLLVHPNPAPHGQEAGRLSPYLLLISPPERCHLFAGWYKWDWLEQGGLIDLRTHVVQQPREKKKKKGKINKNQTWRGEEEHSSEVCPAPSCQKTLSSMLRLHGVWVL